jgi:uncharacterized phage protein gp47/JayE
MAIDILTIQQLQSRIANELILSINAGQTDTSKYVTDVRNSAIGAIGDSMAGGFDENNDVLNQLVIQLFPQTATGIFLERWASFFGITRNSGFQAIGNVVFTGTAATSIPSATLIQKADNTQYATTALGTISTQSISVANITRSGTVATVTTSSNHNLGTGVTVTISGAVETDYNISVLITVTGATTFTYTVAGSPATPATGTILAAFTTALVPIQASNFDNAGNAIAGTQLALVSPLSNVDNTCYVDYAGLIGGLDVETDEALRIRLQERTANFTAPFTAAGLPVFIKQAVAGITRIWVETATPTAGSVTIYFTRDNDLNIIPTATQANTVKNAIIDATTGIKPANTADSGVIVSPPTPVSVDFTFTTLAPNTTDMQTAITNTLTDYFKSDSVNIATDITANEYNALLFSVIDSDGNSPTFTLLSPVGAISVIAGELAILGTITYP